MLILREQISKKYSIIEMDKISMKTLELKHLDSLGDYTIQVIESLKESVPCDPFLHEWCSYPIIANQITTIDYWSVNKLSDVGEKNLYFYFYDIAQWYKSDTPKKINIFELVDLADTKLQVRKAKGKEYINWKRTINQIETFINNVKSEGKFIIRWEWVGEKENTWAHVFLNKDARQIPAAPQR